VKRTNIELPVKKNVFQQEVQYDENDIKMEELMELLREVITT